MAGTRRDLPALAPKRIPAREGRRALLPERTAAAAALSAVLARQPDRPHVGGALLYHRGTDPALAPRAAALCVPDPLPSFPLVPQPAPDRERCRPAREDPRRARRRPGQAGGARRGHHGAALLQRRALRPAPAHRSGARAAEQDAGLELVRRVTLTRSR